MTFFRHLVNQAGRRDMVGKLGRLAAGDEQWPRTANYRELLGYLIETKHPALVPALQCAYNAWQEQG